MAKQNVSLSFKLQEKNSNFGIATNGKNTQIVATGQAAENLALGVGLGLGLGLALYLLSK